MTPWKAKAVREMAAGALHKDAYEDLSTWFSSTLAPAFCEIVLSKEVLEENALIQARESIASKPMLAAFSPSAADTSRNGITTLETYGTHAITSELGANPRYRYL